MSPTGIELSLCLVCGQRFKVDERHLHVGRTGSPPCAEGKRIFFNDDYWKIVEGIIINQQVSKQTA